MKVCSAWFSDHQYSLPSTKPYHDIIDAFFIVLSIGLIQKMPTLKRVLLKLWNFTYFVVSTKLRNAEVLICILNRSGVIDDQKYIEHIMKCWECIKQLFLMQKLWYLADSCLDSMPLIVPFRIYNFEFVYENISIFSPMAIFGIYGI